MNGILILDFMHYTTVISLEMSDEPEKSEKRTLKTSFFDINQGEIGKNLQKISISLSPSALFLRYLHPKKHKLHTALLNTRDSEVQRERKKEFFNLKTSKKYQQK